MDIVTSHIIVEKVFCQLFRHTFRKCRYKYPFFFFDTQLNFFHQVVNLIETRAYFNNRIKQTGRADHLFYNDPFRLYQLIFCRGSTDINHLFCHLLKFFKFQRAVVHCGRQSEPIFYQIDFTGTVASIHGANLRHAYMTFVNNQQKVIREEIEKAIRTGAGSATVEITGIILNAGTVP